MTEHACNLLTRSLKQSSNVHFIVCEKALGLKEKLGSAWMWFPHLLCLQSFVITKASQPVGSGSFSLIGLVTFNLEGA